MESPLPQPTRLARLLELVVDSFWLIVISFVGLYVFLLVLGGFTPASAGGVSLIVGLGIVLLGIHFWRQHRHVYEVTHDPRIKSARERRGY